MADKTVYGHIAAFITILIWGTTFISTKVLLRAFTPVEILVIRFVAGYLALWCVRPAILVLTDARQELYFAAAGLCGITLYYLLENIALTYTAASHVGVIISIAPFFTAAFTCIFLHTECPGRHFFPGFLIAIAGIALLSFSGDAGFKGNPAGDILAVLAAVIWAAYSTITKKISSFGYHTIQVTRRTFFYGLIFMIPVIFLMDFKVEAGRFRDPSIVLNFLFLGLGASALCFVTWNSAVKLLGSVRTSVYIYMVPVITAVTSSVILHEEMTGQMIGGIILTLAGLLITENRKTSENTRQNKG